VAVILRFAFDELVGGGVDAHDKLEADHGLAQRRAHGCLDLVARFALSPDPPNVVG